MKFTVAFLFALMLVCPLWAPARQASAGGLDAPRPPMSTTRLYSFSEDREEDNHYVVRPGDTLSVIAQRFGITTSVLAEANDLGNGDVIVIGQRLLIPGGVTGSTTAESLSAERERASVTERLTYLSKQARSDSPYYRSTWLTYYGRPEVPILGILGEYSIDELVPLLQAQADAYDVANGPSLGVTPAFHLIYGMAMANPGDDGSHLSYLPENVVKAYIERAAQEGFEVILDVQIGALTPLEALAPALPYLKYDNVHLALDPEFAMTTPGQTVPGQPPGAVTAAQINAAQASISTYLQQIGARGRRILIVHQFLPHMIVDKESIYRYDGVDFTICADGFGPPWPKISKYNLFMDENVHFAAFKLFYGWDSPLMTERQTMGVDAYPGIGYMEVTPNMVIYQ